MVKVEVEGFTFNLSDRDIEGSKTIQNYIK